MGANLLSEATCMLTTERTCVLSAAWTWVLLAGAVVGPMAALLTLSYRSPGYLDAEKSDCQKGVRFGMPVLSSVWARRSSFGCFAAGSAPAIFFGAVAFRSGSGRFAAGAGLPTFPGARVAAAGAARSPLFLTQYCTG